jgi:hypothetical protein
VYAVVIAACGAVPAARASDPPLATCVYREEPILDAPAVAETAKKEPSHVTLLAMTPAEGGEVRADSVIEIDVEYHVANFAPDTFFLVPVFPTLARGFTSPGQFSDFHKLQSASGKVHLCVPLKEMYQSRSVLWPLSLMINLHEQVSEYSRMAAHSRSVALNSLDVPAGALKRQEDAMPDDVRLALGSLFAFVENQGALHKVCSGRFPDMRASFIKTFRAWEQRNATHIRQIQEMQYAIHLETFDNPAVAAKVFDGKRADVIDYLNGLKDAELRKSCERAMNALADQTSDLPTVAAANFKIVQKYLADKSKPKAAE